MESIAQVNNCGKELGFLMQDHDSSSTQSLNHSHHEVSATGRTDIQDHCVSSETGQDENFAKHEEGQAKPFIFTGGSDHGFDPSHVIYSHQMAHCPYPYGGGPHFTRLMTAYGPQAMIQHQMMGIVSARVPLPLDLPEDGPIYVNAKQYNGILRRRESRAKLEGQNKLVKARKPYLHESRHIHALNRVRGSGGRFLSTKKKQQSNLAPTSCGNHTSEFDVNQLEKNKPVTSCAEIMIFSSKNVIFKQQDGRFSSIPAGMG